MLRSPEATPQRCVAGHSLLDLATSLCSSPEVFWRMNVCFLTILLEKLNVRFGVFLCGGVGTCFGLSLLKKGQETREAHHTVIWLAHTFDAFWLVVASSVSSSSGGCEASASDRSCAALPEKLQKEQQCATRQATRRS